MDTIKEVSVSAVTTEAICCNLVDSKDNKCKLVTRTSTTEIICGRAVLECVAVDDSHSLEQEPEQVSGKSSSSLDSKQSSFPREEKFTKCKKDAESDDSTIDEELSSLVNAMTLVGSKNFQKAAADVSATQYIPRRVYYYGWFFSETTSLSLKKFAFDYLEKSILNIPNLHEFISFVCSGKDPASCYRKPKSSSNDPKYHITAKFCNRSSQESYEDKAYPNLGQIFDMNIVGIFVTKSTFGYRIALDDSQKELFDNERISERETANASNNNHDFLKSGTPRSRKSKSKLNSGKEAKPPSPIFDANYPGLSFLPQPLNFHPTTNRAHITLGCGYRIPALKTGEDLLDIIDLETQLLSPSSTVSTTDYYVEDLFENIENNTQSVVRQFGRQLGDAFVIYLSHKIIAKAAFMAYP